METGANGMKEAKPPLKDKRKDRLAKALKQNIKRRLEADLKKKQHTRLEPEKQ